MLPMPKPDLVATAEAAVLLGVVPSSVWRMVRAGKLTPAHEHAGHMVFLRRDVEEAAEKRRGEK